MRVDGFLTTQQNERLVYYEDRWFHRRALLKSIDNLLLRTIIWLDMSDLTLMSIVSGLMILLDFLILLAHPKPMYWFTGRTIRSDVRNVRVFQHDSFQTSRLQHFRNSLIYSSFSYFVVMSWVVLDIIAYSFIYIFDGYYTATTVAA